MIFKVKCDCTWKTLDKFGTDQLLLQLFLRFSSSSKWNFFCFIFCSLFLCLRLAACSLPDSFISSWFHLHFVQQSLNLLVFIWWPLKEQSKSWPLQGKGITACELFVAGNLWFIFWKERVNKYCIEEQHWNQATGVHLWDLYGHKSSVLFINNLYSFH